MSAKDVPTVSATRQPFVPRGRRPALDAIRGSAVAAVMLDHALPSHFPNAGIVGVTVFFVLSGYLITGVLASEEARQPVSLHRFYLHRALRLFPALAVFLAVFLVVDVTAHHLHDLHDLVSTLFAGTTYTTDLMPFGLTVEDPLFHLWSLAVEEQFYLVWPFLLLLALRSPHRTRVFSAVMTAFALLLLASVVIARHRLPDLYTLPTSWALPLLTGAAAYLWREQLVSVVTRIGARAVAACAAAVLLAALVVPNVSFHTVGYLVAIPGIGVCAALLIAGTLRVEQLRRPGRLMAALGRISYAAYIWNWPVVLWLWGPDHSHPLSLPKAVLSVPLTIAAAMLSWRLVERPALDLKKRLDRQAGAAAAP